MEMKYKTENRQLTITLTGELDHHAAKSLMDSIDRCIEQNLPAKTLLDLAGLTFMDSSGIAVVLRAKRRMEALAGTLVVVNIPRQASRVLETAGLGRQLVRVGVDDGVGHRLADGGLDVPQLLQGGVQLGGEAGPGGGEHSPAGVPGAGDGGTGTVRGSHMNIGGMS